MKILLVPSVRETFKKQFELSVDINLIKFLNFTFGAGRLINGRGELNMNGESYATENSNGGAVFIIFGIPFFGGEFLLGYRKNNIEYKIALILKKTSALLSQLP